MKNTFSLLLSVAVATLGGMLLIGCSSSGHDHSSHAPASHSHDVNKYYPKAKAYPLDKCLVSDEGFDGSKPYTFVHQGQEIKLCCKDCLADFKNDPAKYISKLNVAE